MNSGFASMAQIIFSLDNPRYVSWLFHSSHNNFYLWKSMVPACTATTTKLIINSVCFLPRKELNWAANATHLAFTIQFLLQTRQEQTSWLIPTHDFSTWSSPINLFHLPPVQVAMGGLNSCGIPGMLQAQLHQFLSLKGLVHCSVTILKMHEIKKDRRI